MKELLEYYKRLHYIIIEYYIKGILQQVLNNVSQGEQICTEVSSAMS